MLVMLGGSSGGCVSACWTGRVVPRDSQNPRIIQVGRALPDHPT